MATWKKVVVSGSAAALASLTLDTALATTEGGTGLTALGTAGSDMLSLDRGTSEQVLRVNNAGNGLEFADASSGDITGIVAGTAITVTNPDSATPTVGVTDAGITATQLASSVAGAGLAGGAGTALSVGVDDSSIEITGDTLNVKALGVSNAMLANDSVTIGSTEIDLGAAATTTIAGLSSVTSTTFVGDLTGNASTATTANGVAANSVTLGTDTTGNYVSALGTGTGVTIGSNTGEGASPTISVDYGTSANQAAQGNVTLAVVGTSAEIEVSNGAASAIGANRSITIGLPNDVTIGQDLTVTRDLTVSNDLDVSGDLKVAGTASFSHSTNLAVADKYILLNSGSSSTGDGGFVVQQGTNGVGELFGYDKDSGTGGRWGVVSGFDADTSGDFTPAAFMATVSTGTANTSAGIATAVGTTYSKAGNIYTVSTGDNEIWIYS